MTDPADHALISGHAEAKLTSLSNREDGGIRMGFVIQPDDVTDALRRARPGTFFVLGYQQFDPDAKEAPSPSPKEKRERKETPPQKPSQHCATWCGNRAFQYWLGVTSFDEADARVKEKLGIKSKRELDFVPGTAEAWKRLHTSFLHRDYLEKEGARKA